MRTSFPIAPDREIYKVDLTEVDAPIYDSSTDARRSHHLKGDTAKGFAKKPSEVVVEGSIPEQAFSPVKK